MTSSIRRAKSTASTLSSSFPASIFERSSTSLMRSSRCFPAAFTRCNGSRPHFLAINTNHTDEVFLLQHWHGDQGSSARKLRNRDAHRIPFGVGRLRRDVGNVDHLLSTAKAAKGATWARTNWSTL